MNTMIIHDTVDYPLPFGENEGYFIPKKMFIIKIFFIELPQVVFRFSSYRGVPNL